MKTTIKAIFFDLGNVIVRLNIEPLEKELNKYGKIDNGDFFNYLMDSKNMNLYHEGRITSNQFYSRTKRHFKLDINYADFYKIWNSMFLPFPETEEIVKKIKEKSPEIKIVLLSNTNETHFEFIKKEYDILKTFDALVVSYEVGKNKPHPKIFQEALKIAGALPKEVFYTDDRLDLIEAARTMGFRAYQFTTPESLIQNLAKCGINLVNNE